MVKMFGRGGVSGQAGREYVFYVRNNNVFYAPKAGHTSLSYSFFSLLCICSRFKKKKRGTNHGVSVTYCKRERGRAEEMKVDEQFFHFLPS